jgi:tetratricopeptide (TPR) repeat protein
LLWALSTISLGTLEANAALDCQYLELHGPSLPGDSTQNDLPFYLAFPDSLGPLKVRVFLEAPKERAREMLKGADWQARPLSLIEKRFLAALRDFMDGRIREAGAEIGSLSRQPQLKLQPFLRIDKGLLMLLAGFPQDAEREWRRGLRGKDGDGVCAEVAWRNLYSLYLADGDFKNAHGLVDEALKSAPKNKWVIFAKGYLLRMLAPGEEWESFLREKSSWKDSLFEIQIAYGKFLKDQGKLSEAAKYYSRGLEGAPNNGPAWLELADIYYRLGYMIFAQTCIRKAFRYGINDPYIFELFSLVLQNFNGSGTRGEETWRMAQMLLEEGFPHDLQSRSMAQLLYHVYCHNGKIEAAENLRQNFWFHFEGPGRSKPFPLGGPKSRPKLGLSIRLSEISFPLIRAMEGIDFYEPF